MTTRLRGAVPPAGPHLTGAVEVHVGAEMGRGRPVPRRSGSESAVELQLAHFVSPALNFPGRIPSRSASDSGSVVPILSLPCLSSTSSHL